MQINNNQSNSNTVPIHTETHNNQDRQPISNLFDILNKNVIEINVEGQLNYQKSPENNFNLVESFNEEQIQQQNNSIFNQMNQRQIILFSNQPNTIIDVETIAFEKSMEIFIQNQCKNLQGLTVPHEKNKTFTQQSEIQQNNQLECIRQSTLNKPPNQSIPNQIDQSNHSNIIQLSEEIQNRQITIIPKHLITHFKQYEGQSVSDLQSKSPKRNNSIQSIQYYETVKLKQIINHAKQLGTKVIKNQTQQSQCIQPKIIIPTYLSHFQQYDFEPINFQLNDQKKVQQQPSKNKIPSTISNIQDKEIFNIKEQEIKKQGITNQQLKKSKQYYQKIQMNNFLKSEPSSKHKKNLHKITQNLLKFQSSKSDGKNQDAVTNMMKKKQLKIQDLGTKPESQIQIKQLYAKILNLQKVVSKLTIQKEQNIIKQDEDSKRQRSSYRIKKQKYQDHTNKSKNQGNKIQDPQTKPSRSNIINQVIDKKLKLSSKVINEKFIKQSSNNDLKLQIQILKSRVFHLEHQRIQTNKKETFFNYESCRNSQNENLSKSHIRINSSSTRLNCGKIVTKTRKQLGHNQLINSNSLKKFIKPEGNNLIKNNNIICESKIFIPNQQSQFNKYKIKNNDLQSELIIVKNSNQFNIKQSDFFAINEEKQQIINKYGFMLNINNFSKINNFQSVMIPQLPPKPSKNDSQKSIINLANKIFSMFQTRFNQKDHQIQVLKYDNFVHIFTDEGINIIWYYDSGQFYLGQLLINQNYELLKQGSGFQFLEGKYFYEGQFKQNKRNGYGLLKMIQNPKIIYFGQWLNGLKHGKGKQLEHHKKSYDGEWKCGNKHGYGRVYLNENIIYQGYFQNGYQNGYGQQKFENGDIYKGNYINNKFNGKGLYIWANGSSYQGQFFGGLRHGYGKWKSSSQLQDDCYQGEFKNNQKHGNGVYKWANGNIYQGQFKNDQRVNILRLKKQSDDISLEQDKLKNKKNNIRSISHNKKYNGQMSKEDSDKKIIFKSHKNQDKRQKQKIKFSKNNIKSKSQHKISNNHQNIIKIKLS